MYDITYLPNPRSFTLYQSLKTFVKMSKLLNTTHLPLLAKYRYFTRLASNIGGDILMYSSTKLQVLMHYSFWHRYCDALKKVLAAKSLSDQLMLRVQGTRSNRNFAITESVYFVCQQPPSKSRKLCSLSTPLLLVLFFRCTGIGLS
jgi:hypothetical protein